MKWNKTKSFKRPNLKRVGKYSKYSYKRYRKKGGTMSNRDYQKGYR